MLRCKFKVERVVRTSDGRDVRLRAVTADSEENKSWSKYTPSGELALAVTNEAAFAMIDGLQSGDEVFVDLKPVKQATACCGSGLRDSSLQT